MLTKSNLIEAVNRTGSFYFSKDTMQFFGDTRSNYYLSKVIFNIDNMDYYKLSRKKPVNGGLKDPVYINTKTFKILKGDS